MQIALLTHSFPAKRPYSWAKYWTIAGHHVTVFARSVRETDFPNPGFEIYGFENFKNYDVAISTQKGAVHQTAAQLKSSGQVKRWIADLSTQDFPLRRAPFKWVDHFQTTRLLKKSDMLITSTHQETSRISMQIPKHPVHTIEEGFDPILPHQLSSEPVFPEDGKLRVVYSGVLTDTTRLAPLFSVIQSISIDPFLKYLLHHFEVVFLGEQYGILTDLVAQFHVEPWIRILPFKSKEKSLRALRDAHISLYTEAQDELFFETLYFQTPILILGTHQLTPQERMIIRSGAGKVVTKETDIHSYLVDMLANIRKRPTELDRSFLEKYSRKSLAIKLLNLIQ